MLSRRVQAVSDRVQSYKLARRSSTRSAVSTRSAQVTSPDLDNIEEQPSQSTPDPMHAMSEDGVQLPRGVETVEIMRESGRATPADPSSNYMLKKSSKSDLRSKKKNHAFYDEAFAVREAGQQTPAGAGIWVEMKTNVILESEFDFIKSLSQIIAKRYSRPEECVAVSIDHSSCMIMGGTFEGCYFLTITSLTSISPTCNKRNVALISEWISTNLGVPSSRGYIRFVELDIANYAIGGMTCLDMLERERSPTRMSGNLTTGVGDNMKPRKGIIGKVKPSITMDENRPPSKPGDDVSPVDIVSSLDSGSMTSQSAYNTKTTPVMKRGRSMFSLFNRAQRIPA